MKKNTEDLAFKSRSALKCTQLGYKTFADNFKQIFKRSWLATCIYALICSTTTIFSQIFANDIQTMLQAMVNTSIGPKILLNGNFLTLYTAILVFIVLGTVAELSVYANSLSIFKRNEDKSLSISKNITKFFHFNKRLLWRMVKGFFFAAILYFIVSGIISALLFTLIWHFTSISIFTKTIVLLVFLLTFMIIVALPSIYTFFRYTMSDRGSFFTMLPSSFMIGLRRMGFLFAVTFTSMMLLIVAEIIFCLPAEIISTAALSAYTGQFMGDPLGMPSYVFSLIAIVIFITSFFSIFIRIPAIFAFFHMSNSIDAYEEEKQNHIKNENYIK